MCTNEFVRSESVGSRMRFENKLVGDLAILLSCAKSGRRGETQPRWRQQTVNIFSPARGEDELVRHVLLSH
jgi:hypothetical protein